MLEMCQKELMSARDHTPSQLRNLKLKELVLLNELKDSWAQIKFLNFIDEYQV